MAAISGIELVLAEMGHAVEAGKGVAAAQRVFADTARKVFPYEFTASA
jgi:hypothetical protein